MNKKEVQEIIRDFRQRNKINAFAAIQHAITELKMILKTENLCDLSKFLLNESDKTALYTGLCNHSSEKNSFKKSFIERWRDINDVNFKKGAFVSSAIKAICGFFRQYEDYTLAFSIGTQYHQGCVFVRKGTNLCSHSLIKFRTFAS